jgi:hypothetical protein
MYSVIIKNYFLPEPEDDPKEDREEAAESLVITLC